MAHFPKYVNSWQFPLRHNFSILFPGFPSYCFQRKEISEIAGRKPTFCVILRFCSPLLPSPSHAFLNTMLYSYNQVLMANHPPADKQISARFSDWKTQFLYVSVASKNLKNDRLSDIFFQKTRQNHSWKGRKNSKNRGFIAYSAIKQSSHTSLFPPIPKKKISHKFRSLKKTPTHIHENLERLTLRGCKTAWPIKQG